MELMKQRFNLEKASAKQYELIQIVYNLGDLFEDMLFSPHTVASDYFVVMSQNGRKVYDSMRPELEYFDYAWFNFRVASLKKHNAAGSYNRRSLTLTIDSETFEGEEAQLNRTILHEMIHLHEHVLDEYLPSFYREIYFLALYGDLKKKIPDLDEKILQCCHMSRSEGTATEGGSHGLLFALKSFDLDLRTEKEIGTIFGYGRTDYLLNKDN